MRNRQAGFNMLEILFSLLIVTTGLLGLAATQVIAQRAEQESYQRAQAIVLMTDIVDRINTNRKAAICYNITTNTTAGTGYLGTAGGGKYDVSSYSCPALATNPAAQTFNAVFTKDHTIGSTVRPTIWPTAILNEGDSLAFDILGVASPDPGSDLTVVIQT